MAITRDQVATVLATATGGTQLIPWGTNPAAGASVVVGIGLNQIGRPTNVIDNGVFPSIFTLDSFNAVSTHSFWIFRADNVSLPSAGAYGVNFTVPGSVQCVAGGASYTGGPLGLPTAINTNSATSASVTTLAVVVSTDGMAFGGFRISTGSTTITLTNANFTTVDVNTNGAIAQAGAMADSLVAGSETATWTVGSSALFNACIAAYIPGGGPGPGAVFFVGTPTWRRKYRPGQWLGLPPASAPSLTVNAGAATVTAQANQPIAVIAPIDQTGATSTATGDAPTAVISPSSGAATVIADGNPAVITAAPNAGAATATATGDAATPVIAPNAGAATVIVDGNSVTVLTGTIVLPGAATVNAVSNGPNIVITTQAGGATVGATGTGPNASVTTGPGVATVSAVSDPPTATIAPNAGASTVSATGDAPTATIAPNAGAATSTATASSPIPVIAPNAGAATVIVDGNPATVATGGVAPAGAATVSATATGPVVAVQPSAGAATATGQAGAGVSVTANAGAATVGASAGAAQVAVLVLAGKPTVTANVGQLTAIAAAQAGQALVQAMTFGANVIGPAFPGTVAISNKAVYSVVISNEPEQTVAVSNEALELVSISNYANGKVAVSNSPVGSVVVGNSA